MKKTLHLLLLMVLTSSLSMAQLNSLSKTPEKLGAKLGRVKHAISAAKTLPEACSTFTFDTADRVWIPELNYTYTYDQGVLVEEVSTDNMGLYVSKATYVYDGKNLTENLVQFYDNGTWVNSYKLVLKYNANDELVKEEILDWFDNQWNVSYGLGREYIQISADTVMIIDSMWNGSGYEAVQKVDEIFVSGSKDLSVMIMYMPNAAGSSWEESYKESYSYDGNGKLTNILKQNWNGSDWINFMQNTEYVFDTIANQVSSFVTQTWNNAMQTWNNYSVDSTQYLDFKSIVNTAYYFGPSGLIPSTRMMYLNDEYMNQVLAKQEIWNTQMGSWEAMLHNEIEYTYSNDSLILQQIYLGLNNYNVLDSNYKKVFVYPTTTGYNNTKTFDYSLFPNPTKDVLNIKLSNVHKTEKVILNLKNISGQLIESSSFTGNESKLDVSALNTGLYLLEIITETGSQSSKFIIK